MSQTFYRAFEDRYRGSRETIKERLRAYAGYVQPLLTLARPATALDLGCGRGEWLELLGEYGFQPQGVDLDEGMLAACRERGLVARNQDALAALREQPDDSLALVSAFHLVEHIPFDLVQDLMREALRALQPGGLLILETPNPENLTVGATSFYLDPSHLHPLPPALLGFAAEHAGFARQRIVRLQEDAALHTPARIGLITVLEGVSPDYSVVAQKAAPAVTQSLLDAAFGTSHGVTLGDLAQRYEQQQAHQHAEIHHALARIATEATQSNLHAAQLSAELSRLSGEVAQMRAHAAQQDARLTQAEVHAAEMGQRVVDLLSSSSWRVTAPMRSAATTVYRLRAAVREQRVGRAMRFRAVAVLRRVGGAVLRRPRLKRAIRAVLRHVPALEARLYRTMLDNSAATRLILEEEPGELSPRAARIYRQLKQEQTRMADADRH